MEKYWSQHKADGGNETKKEKEEAPKSGFRALSARWRRDYDEKSDAELRGEACKRDAMRKEKELRKRAYEINSVNIEIAKKGLL